MKNPFLSFLTCLALLGSCKTSPSSASAATSPVTPTDLLGPISRADLQKPPYNEWFDDGYQTYQTDPAPLASTDFSDVEILVFLGTWCSDSQREVPHLFKVLDQADFPEGKISMIAVDENKQQPAEAIEQWGIEYVPTIIVSRNGKELGRIVETPQVSLETDLASILAQD